MAWWIFQNLVSTAALAVIVAALCRFTRIGPVARHALWVLVLVKFVTPPLVVWPWAAPDPFGLAARVAETRTAVHGLALPPQPSTGSRFSSPLVEDIASPAAPVSIWPWIFGLWIAGSLAVLAIEIARVARMARRVRTPHSVDPAVIQRAAELSAQLALRPVPVVGVAGRDAPAVWGLGRPRLLWPSELAADASDACIDGLLLHELAHIKRRDHLVGWIELAAGVAWWWNPVFWQVRSALREQAELACDAWVISQLPDGRRAYAESLLTLSGPEVRGVPPVAVMGIRAGSRRLLERRLVMIMKGRSAVRLPRAGTLSLGLLALATLPAWATSVHQTTATTVPVPPSVKQATTVPVIVQKQEKAPVKTVVTKPLKGEVVAIKPDELRTYTLQMKPARPG